MLRPLLVASLALLAAAPLVGAGDVDARLRRMLDTAEAAPGCCLRADAGGRPWVAVTIEGDASTVAPAVAAAGGRVRGAIADRFVTADVPLAAVPALARRADVRHVKAGVRLRLLADLANLPGGTGTRGPDQVALPPPHASDHPAVARAGAGAGVAVALVDTGVDVFHPDLRHPDGSTRVLAYWDQTDRAAGRGPAGFGYGREYTRADLDRALAGARALAPSARDTSGHGTHVLGTIAGNGRAAAGPPYAAHQFTGAAPRADLIVVKFDFDGPRNDTSHLLDAVAYCLRAAGARPCVVNLSLGADLGPHDGSTLEERALDALTGPGRIVVCAAGNAARPGPAGQAPRRAAVDRLHGQGRLAPGRASEVEVTLVRDAPGAARGEFALLDVWYPGDAACDVQVVAPDGTVHADPRWRTGAGGARRVTRHGVVHVYNGGDPLGWGAANGDHELYVELAAAPDAALAAGRWRVRLTGRPGSAAGDYHGWHALSAGLQRSTLRYDGARTDDRMTVGIPATGRRMIAVGAYATRTAWDTGRGAVAGYDLSASPTLVGDLAPFSSRGPSRDGRTLPHVAAPGVGVVSCLSRDARAAFPLDPAAVSPVIGPRADPPYVVLQGTSMSAPSCAGVVALALALDPSLTPEDVATLLFATARVDAYVTGSLFASDPRRAAPNDDWGAGKLDAPGLLEAAWARRRTPVAAGR
ncbi:MAG: S8 family serine peptidase [Planctomycetes bacterium]|nr:S8 family serine peptidase [Planctomycetota bacterium]